MKVCTRCLKKQPISEYWRHPHGASGLTPSCKTCHRAASAKWRASNPEKQKIKTEQKRLQSQATPHLIKKDRHLKNKYGISMFEWTQMFIKQNECCAICNRHQSVLDRTLQVDHNHNTGQVRGLLCTKCNTKLAVIEENGFIEKARVYLQKSEIKLVGNII